MSEQLTKVSTREPGRVAGTKGNSRLLLRAGVAAVVFASALIAMASATSAAPRPVAGNDAESAAARTGIAAVVQANGTDQNVYYVGKNGQIYNWAYSNDQWRNKKL